MSLRLSAVPASADQLAHIRADPAASAAALDPSADADAHRLRNGPTVHLRDLWPLVHALLTAGAHAGSSSAREFLIRGGAPIGERCRAFAAAEAVDIAAAVDDGHSADPAGQFEVSETQASGVWFNAGGEVRPGEAGVPVARERLAEVQALLRNAVDEHLGLLVVRRIEQEGDAVDLRLVTDAAIARFRESPTLLDAWLDTPPSSPVEAAVVRGWYALHVALTELGDTEAHRFVAEGGELVDEALQLRVFDPDAVAALSALLMSIDADALLAALRPALDHEGLETDEADALAEDYPELRRAVASWSADHRGMVTMLV